MSHREEALRPTQDTLERQSLGWPGSTSEHSLEEAPGERDVWPALLRPRHPIPDEAEEEETITK